MYSCIHVSYVHISSLNTNQSTPFLKPHNVIERQVDDRSSIIGDTASHGDDMAMTYDMDMVDMDTDTGMGMGTGTGTGTNTDPLSNGTLA